MKRFKIAKMIIAAGFRKSVSTMLTLVTFLLVLNILIGILFSVTGILSGSITQNASVHFMEIINEANDVDILELKKEIDNMPDIKSSFIDVSHPVMIPCNNSSGMEVYTLIGIPRELLSEFGIFADKDTFLFLPNRDMQSYEGMDVVEIEETLFVNQPDGSRVPELLYFYYDITGYYDPIPWDIFPQDIVIIDEPTAMDIALGMSFDGVSPMSARVIAFVYDVSKMHDIEQEIISLFPSMDVRYALKYTGKLPEYATVLIAVSGIIIAILAVFCYTNIRSSVRQMLILRQRDIGLFSLFGVQNSDIVRVFVIEYVYYGVVSYVFVSVVTVLLFTIFKQLFRIDLLTNYVWIYLVSNAVLAVVIFAVIAAKQVHLILNRIDNAKIYKEILN